MLCFRSSTFFCLIHNLNLICSFWNQIKSAKMLETYCGSQNVWLAGHISVPLLCCFYLLSCFPVNTPQLSCQSLPQCVCWLTGYIDWSLLFCLLSDEQSAEQENEFSQTNIGIKTWQAFERRGEVGTIWRTSMLRAALVTNGLSWACQWQLDVIWLRRGTSLNVDFSIHQAPRVSDSLLPAPSSI